MSEFVSASRPTFRPAALALAAAFAAGLAGPAEAESFLKSLARQAAQRAAAAAVAANNGQSAEVQAPAADQDDGGAAAEPEAPAETPTTGPTPWPVNAGARNVQYPSQLRFTEALQSEKKAFEEFSKVSCDDCEGGYSYDAWAQHFVRLDGSYKAWEKKLGALAMGETLSWQGSQSKGAITVVGEQSINGWPCKQLKWTLTKPKGRAERPGLICFAKESSYSGSDSWNIAF